MKFTAINNKKEQQAPVIFNNIAMKLNDLAFRCAEEDAEHCSQQFLDTVAENLYGIADQVAGLLNAPLDLKRDYKKKLVFLASPFTNENTGIQESNFHVSILATRWLMKKGFNVYNPLSHGRPIWENSDIDFIRDYTPYFNWHEMNCRIMAACDAFVWIDRGEDTDNSAGMRAELTEAQRLGLPILAIQFNGNSFNFVYQKQYIKSAFFNITHIAED